MRRQKKAMATLSVCLPKTPEWKLLEKMRKTRDWDHVPRRAVSREREQSSSMCHVSLTASGMGLLIITVAWMSQ